MAHKWHTDGSCRGGVYTYKMYHFYGFCNNKLEVIICVSVSPYVVGVLKTDAARITKLDREMFAR